MFLEEVRYRGDTKGQEDRTRLGKDHRGDPQHLAWVHGVKAAGDWRLRECGKAWERDGKTAEVNAMK